MTGPYLLLIGGRLAVVPGPLSYTAGAITKARVQDFLAEYRIKREQTDKVNRE